MDAFGGYFMQEKKKSEKWAIANMFNIIKLWRTGNSYPCMSPWLALIKETVKIQVSEDEANRTFMLVETKLLHILWKEFWQINLA